jgi:beta-galactosidase
MTNSTILFNGSWEFAKTGLDVHDWRALSFSPVEIPHDWLIYNSPDKFYEDSIGWYRKQFWYTPARGKHCILRFDGVYMDSTLYCNGKPVGVWKYGYSSFEHEMTPFLIEGTNEILLKVIHRAPNSRWYSGAGIYRNVWLIERGPSYIPTDGVYINTKFIKNKWQLTIETELHLQRPAILQHTLYWGRNRVAEGFAYIPQPKDICSTINMQTLWIEKPRLWSPDHPQYYRLETSLFDEEGSCLERVNSNVGFRTMVFSAEKGLIVNNIPTKIHGTCEHHDLGSMGAAFNREVQRYRFSLLKKMGVNTIRTSHNMPDPQVMDLADEMGFFIISEAFDMWERPKTEFDYARFFPEWFAKDIASWVRRDRNHPSLLMWSIGNEIYDTHVAERGQELTRILAAEVRKHDPRENAPVTIGSNYMPWENAQKCADILKYAGYNYGEKYYALHHQQHPDWIIYGSETSSVVQSRGIYHFPYERTILTDEDQQCSSLGNSPTSWGAPSPEACINADRQATFSPGMCIWSGFDYIGEPTPYHTKNAYFGQIDTAGFPKDSYYIYQAAWTDHTKQPMVHLFPYWDWNPGQLIDVRVCTNAPAVALFCNGELIGQKQLWDEEGLFHTAWWKVPYKPGTIKAIAYDETGNSVAQAERHSFGDPVRMVITPSKPYVKADGSDMVLVAIHTVDEAGHPVENANNRITIEVQGPGRLRGLDNGDSTDYDSYKGTSRRLFNNRLMALIGSTTTPGSIRVLIHSPSLPSETLLIPAISVQNHEPDTYTVFDHNEARPILTGQEQEIPLRKIELHLVTGSLDLSPETPWAEIAAVLYPANATYQDIVWSVVNDAGITSPLACLEIGEHTALIRPRGDGTFRIRCTSTNGTKQVRLISQLECTARGFGKLFKDPYQFISAGLYDDANDGIGPGNEQGIATSRDMTTIVGFHDIDFGSDGSDTIHIPIFTLSNEAYRFQIWQGYPEQEGSVLLGDLVYQKNSIWNVYQEATYRLQQRLRLVTSLYFVTHAKMHIKGFYFEKQNRSTTKIKAQEFDELYGDAYTITKWGITDIGNNVTITFRDLHFENWIPHTLTIFGRSKTDRNSIHLKLVYQGIEQIQLIEFAYSESPVQRSYPLMSLPENLQSLELQVSFIFLPGSSFDFGWFQFE